MGSRIHLRLLVDLPVNKQKLLLTTKEPWNLCLLSAVAPYSWSLPVAETNPGKAGIFEYSLNTLPRVGPRSHCPSGKCMSHTDPESNGDTHVLTHPTKVWGVLSFPHWLKLINEIVSGTAESAFLFSLLPPLPWSHTLGIWHTSRVTHRAVRSCYFPAENFPELLHLPQKPTRHYISRPINSFSFGHTVELVGSSFPDQGLNPCALHWKHGVLTSGMPGRSALPLKSHLHYRFALATASCFHGLCTHYSLSLNCLPQIHPSSTFLPPPSLYSSCLCVRQQFLLPVGTLSPYPALFLILYFRVFYDCVAYCLSVPY